MDNVEALQMMAGMVWAVVAIFCGFYFVGCYLLEILAQKTEEPRWMAWLPLFNGYLMFRMAGWGGWFWAMFAGWIGAALLAALSPGLALILLIPVGIVTVVLSIGIWLKIAVRRGLSAGVGVLVVLPNFMPMIELVLPTMGLLTVGSWLASLGAFAYIVFYDGGPEHSPHFAGYIVTTCLAALIGVPMMLLPGQIAENPEFAAQMAELEAVLAAAGNGGPFGRDGGEGEDVWADFGVGETPSASSSSPAQTARAAQAAYDAPPDECPDGAREAGSRPPAGTHWWCEAQIGGEWVRHGPTRKWYDAAQVESEGTYAKGQEDGTWSRYWKTGGARVRADFRAGRQHGWMRTWDELGRLASEVYYENGEPVGSPASR